MRSRHVKKGISILIIAAMAVSLASCGATKTDENGRTIYELTLSTHDPSGSGNTQYQREWAEMLSEATDGQVEVTIFAGGTLASSTDALDAVEAGSCDIAWIYTGFYANQFPLTDVATLPLVGIESPVQATNALWDLYESSEALQTELSKRFKTLMLYTNNPNYIGTTSKPVYTVDDMAGLKLRASAGSATEMVTAWGGTPISMGPSDMYQSVEKGVIDGYLFEYSGIGSFNLVEVTDYYTELPICVGPFMLVMNTAKWESLPEDIQDAIMECSGRETSIGAAEVFVSDAEETVAAIEKQGAEIIEPTEEAVAGFQEAADAYNEKWAEAHSTDDFDAEAYLEEFKAAVEKYAE